MSTDLFDALEGLECIQLAGVSAKGTHGVYEDERTTGQTFVADVDMYLDLAGARVSDDLGDTLDYAHVAGLVARVLAGDAQNLIERVADEIARRVLECERVIAVRVRVHKPQAPLDVPFDDVAVTVWAGLEGLRERADGGSAVEAPVSAVTDFPGLDRTPSAPREVVLALGANVGDCEATLRAAVAELDGWKGIGVKEVSPLIRTAAVLHPGQSAQPDYLNAVVLAQTMLSPRDLLRATRAIEDAHGRVRAEEWGPRTLDIDLISYEGVTSLDPQLRLPHPRAASRAFVLMPWQYVAPDAVLEGVPISELIERAPDRSGVRSIHPDWLTPVPGEDGESPLPLPKWNALTAPANPRILDDPDGIIPSDDPVDPRLRPSGPATGEHRLGIAGVSDSPVTHVPVPVPQPQPPRATLSLWQRIKRFFTGAKPQVDAPIVVDTTGVTVSEPLPRPLPEAPGPVSVVDEEPLSALAAPVPEARPETQPIPADGLPPVTEPIPVDEDGVSLASPGMPQWAPLSVAQSEQDTLRDEAASESEVEPADRGVPAPPADVEQKAERGSHPRGELDGGGQPAPTEDAGETVMVDADGGDVEGVTTQPMSLSDIADEADAPHERRPAPAPSAPHRQSLKDRLAGFEPVPPPHVAPESTTGGAHRGAPAGPGEIPPPPFLDPDPAPPAPHHVSADDIEAAATGAPLTGEIARPTTTGIMRVVREAPRAELDEDARGETPQ